MTQTPREPPLDRIVRHYTMLPTTILLATLAMQTNPDFIAPGATVQKLPGDYRFTEGPVWLADGTLLFSDIPADTLYIYDGQNVKPFRQPSFNANGNTLDNEKRLLTAQHGSRTLTRTTPGQPDQVLTLAATFEGKKLNSPNDIAVHPSGAIFFTDPTYGIRPEQKEQAANRVYVLLPQDLGQLPAEPRAVFTGRAQPNGLAFSPDGNTLYLADSEAGGIQALAINPANPAAPLQPTTPWESPSPDGLRVDQDGRVWAACADGVRVYSPQGKLLQTIPFPEQPANLCFGGQDGKTLFVTARRGVYSLQLAIPGIRPGFPNQ